MPEDATLVERPQEFALNTLVSRRIWAVALLIVILAVVSAIRVRLLDFPLERDEGEYAYPGQLLLQGISPYRQAYNIALKLPGTVVGYALIMGMFGQTTVGIHIGLILINLATAILVFQLAKRMCGDWGGTVAAGTYALLSISPPTLGLAAHATHFVMLPALAGILLLQGLNDRTSLFRIFSGGLLIGLAVLMKQSGAPFGLFAASWITWCELSPTSRQWRRLALRLGCLALGGMLPFVLMCLVLVLTGVFDRFWFWTIQYALAHTSVATVPEAAQLLFQTARALFMAAPGLWAAAGLGLLLLFCDPSLQRWRFFVSGFCLCSFVAVCPGGYFRGHYFLQLVPAAGLLAAVAVRVTTGFLARRQLPFAAATLPALVVALGAISSLFTSRAIFFQLTPVQACRAIYGANPFPEAVEIGRYLAAHCAPDARIAVIGSEPQIYFYSRRLGATGYICTYPLVEPQPYASMMQQEMIREIETANPQYLVFVNVRTSWLGRPDSERLLFDWFDKYRQEHLQLVGLVDIVSRSQTDYRGFDSREPLAPPRSDRWLAVFKNRLAPDHAGQPSR